MSTPGLQITFNEMDLVGDFEGRTNPVCFSQITLSNIDSNKVLMAFFHPKHQLPIYIEMEFWKAKALAQQLWSITQLNQN